MSDPPREAAHEEQAPERLRALRDEIKRRIDYRAYYLRYCPEAKQSGARLHALCPIPTHRHSGKGSPSLSVDLQHGLFNCFSRAEGGDAITFYELMHGVNFARAVRELARELGVGGGRRRSRPRLAQRAAPDAPDPEAHGGEAPDPPGPEEMSAVCERFLEACRRESQLEGVSYLTGRGIDAATMSKAGVAYFPLRAYRRVMRAVLAGFPLETLQRSGLFNRRRHLTFYHHRLLFPFRVEGRAVYLQARTTAAGVEPRWHNMRGPVPALYNSDSLAELPSGSTVFLVEGFTDTLTLVANGFNAVGLVGAGGFKDEWLAPLGRFRVVAALDPDAAGRRASARYEELFAARGARLAVVSLPSDVNDFFRHNPAAAVELQLLAEAAVERAAAG
ncbi:MAG TPA: CHC2 zinc finger domain-containing protein [Pyrinomonadaceae bacterium]|nr:CHC2 zinc finger domain-containing protein [Pyrinomonadaceae bacterium]